MRLYVSLYTDIVALSFLLALPIKTVQKKKSFFNKAFFPPENDFECVPWPPSNMYITALGHENIECLRSHDIDGRGRAEAVKHAI